MLVKVHHNGEWKAAEAVVPDLKTLATIIDDLLENNFPENHILCFTINDERNVLIENEAGFGLVRREHERRLLTDGRPAMEFTLKCFE